jgi:flagellar FliJ protein
MTPATLTRLIDRARDKTQAAELRFAGLQRQVEQARGHLDILNRYAEDYSRRLAPRAGGVHDARAHENERVFLTRLQQAIEAQRVELESRQGAAAAGAADLAQCRRRQKSLETLLQRRLDQQRQSEARKEQKDTDEFAQRAHERTRRAHRDKEESGVAAGIRPGAAAAQWES